MVVDLDWWVYLFLVLLFFASCVILNYIVKKVNEAKLEERFTRMRQKVSTTQATQVHGPSIEIEGSRGSKPQSGADKSHNSPTGISLVFNQEENMLTGKRRKYLDNKNIVDLSKREGSEHALVLKTESSQESNEISSSNKNEKNDTIRKTGSYRISPKDSKVIGSVATVKEDVNQGASVKLAVDSILGKIIDNIYTATTHTDESKSENTLTEWIRDYIVSQIPKEDAVKSSDLNT